MRTTSEDMTEAERSMLADIAENGVHIVHVADGDDGPGCSFSVGLWHSFEQPEVIVFGLEDDVAQDLLDAIADEASEGRRFLPGSRHEGLLVDYPVRFLDVPAAIAARHCARAAWAYDGAEFPCVQLVWPDKQGRWPWDSGVREGFAAAQPIIGRRAP